MCFCKFCRIKKILYLNKIVIRKLKNAKKAIKNIFYYRTKYITLEKALC